MSDAWRQRLATGDAVVAGVLSGTSADGIDVVLTRPGAPRDGDVGPPTTLAFETRPFEPALAARVRGVLDGEPCGLREAALLSRDLGLAFGTAARESARAAGLELDLVGSHGQTVWHHDGEEATGAATLQLGDGDHVARAAGAATVSDFRQADVAAGGEGAPLSALADPLLFAGLERPAPILNLGGLANLTLLPEDPLAPPLAFDTGPCGSLLDALARRLLDRERDEGGRAAAHGRPAEEFVREQLAHPFFARTPPKSTGRDTFGEAWVDAFLQQARAHKLLLDADDPYDVLASGCELVAATVALALERFAPDASAGRLVLAGGGVHNATLVAALGRRTGLEPVSSAEVGVDPDAREALVFAVLAARAALDLPAAGAALPGVRGPTGAPAGGRLGKLSAPPPGP